MKQASKPHLVLRPWRLLLTRQHDELLISATSSSAQLGRPRNRHDELCLVLASQTRGRCELSTHRFDWIGSQSRNPHRELDRYNLQLIFMSSYRSDKHYSEIFLWHNVKSSPRHKPTYLLTDLVLLDVCSGCQFVNIIIITNITNFLIISLFSSSIFLF